MENLMFNIRLSVLEGVLINTPELKERYLKIFKFFSERIIQPEDPELDLKPLEDLMKKHLELISSFEIPLK